MVCVCHGWTRISGARHSINILILMSHISHPNPNLHSKTG